MVETTDIDYADFVRQVIAALEAAGVEYMIGGAMAVWAWGEPPRHPGPGPGGGHSFRSD